MSSYKKEMSSQSSALDQFFKSQSISDLEHICRWRSPKNQNKSTEATCGLVSVASQIPAWIQNNKNHKFGRPTDPQVENLNKTNRIQQIMSNDYNRLFLTQLIQKDARQQLQNAIKRSQIKNDRGNKTDKLRSLSN